MQEMILILSRCQTRRISPRTQKTYFRFHFKGFYNGVKIKEIHVFGHHFEILEKGRDYLLWVKFLEVREAILDVQLIKFKEIE